jgi:hypothetical protein
LETDIAALPAGVWDEDLSGHTTAGTAGKILNDVDTGGIGGPIEQTSIPSSRTLLVSSRRVAGEFAIANGATIRMRPGETLYWAVDLKGTQLAPGDLVNGMQSPTVTGGESTNLTVSAYGVSGTLAKMKIALSSMAETTDDIAVELTIAPQSGEILTIAVPVTVGN